MCATAISEDTSPNCKNGRQHQGSAAACVLHSMGRPVPEHAARSAHHLAIIVPITIGAIFFLLFLLFSLRAFCRAYHHRAAIRVHRRRLRPSSSPVNISRSPPRLDLSRCGELPSSTELSWSPIFANSGKKGSRRLTAVVEGTRLRFRPVMMTATVAALGLGPIPLRHRSGLGDSAPVGDRRHRRTGHFDSSHIGPHPLSLRHFRRQNRKTSKMWRWSIIC